VLLVTFDLLVHHALKVRLLVPLLRLSRGQPKILQQLFQRLPRSLGNLIGMHLEARCDLLNRPLPAKFWE